MALRSNRNSAPSPAQSTSVTNEVHKRLNTKHPTMNHIWCHLQAVEVVLPFRKLSPPCFYLGGTPVLSNTCTLTHNLEVGLLPHTRHTRMSSLDQLSTHGSSIAKRSRPMPNTTPCVEVFPDIMEGSSLASRTVHQ